MPGFIDIHHHFFPPDLDKAKDSASSGWRTPEENLPWTPDLSISTMSSMGIQASILSFPAYPSGEISTENRALARRKNDYVANICRQHPSRFGFFATLPFLDDVQGVLSEITYAFDTIGADGISISSSYGESASSSYVGDSKYEPIWAELNQRQAVVFLHGNQIPSSVPWPHPTLGIPVCEVKALAPSLTRGTYIYPHGFQVPNETFKAAAHLVVTGRKRQYPNVKIILAHLGGNTPFLAPRVAVLSRHMGCQLTTEQILEDFSTYYYDTALSAWGPNLLALDSFVPQSQILFGTDFPAVSVKMLSWYTQQLENHYGADVQDEKFLSIVRNNALRLFPRLHQRILTSK